LCVTLKIKALTSFKMLKNKKQHGIMSQRLESLVITSITALWLYTFSNYAHEFGTWFYRRSTYINVNLVLFSDWNFCSCTQYVTFSARFNKRRESVEVFPTYSSFSIRLAWENIYSVTSQFKPVNTRIKFISMW